MKICSYLITCWVAMLLSGCNVMKSGSVDSDELISSGKYVEKYARMEVRNLTGSTIIWNDEPYKPGQSLFVFEPADQDIIELKGTSNKKNFSHSFYFRGPFNFSEVFTPQYKYAVFDYFNPSEVKSRNFVFKAFDSGTEENMSFKSGEILNPGIDQIGLIMGVYSATQVNARWTIEYRGYFYQISPEGQVQELVHVKYTDEGITEDIWKQLYPGKIGIRSIQYAKNTVVISEAIDRKTIKSRDFNQENKDGFIAGSNDYAVELKGYPVPNYFRVTSFYDMHQLDRGLPIYVVVQNTDTDREIEVFYKNNLSVIVKHSESLAFEMEDGDRKSQLTFNVYPIIRGVRKTSANNSVPITVSDIDFNIGKMTHIQNTFVKGLYRFESGKIKFLENPGSIPASLIMQGVKTTNFFNKK